MRLRTIVLVALVGAVTATAVRATSIAGDPLGLALQRSDMPSTVEGSLLGPAAPHRMTQDSLRFIGTGLKGADYSYTWKAGGSVNVPGLGPADKEWHVGGEVLVAPGNAAAGKLFADGKAAGHGFFADFGTEKATPLHLPAFGSEQFGLLGPDAGGPQAMVFVHRGSVVWELRVGHSPAQWKVTTTQVVAVLKTYALKQKTRVGAG